MVKIPPKVSERLTKGIKKFQKELKGLKERNKGSNEAETVDMIQKMLNEVFGFKDKEVRREVPMSGRKRCDLAVQIDEKTKFLIEAKTIGKKLMDKDRDQAIRYGVNKGVQLVVLTNGIKWEIYKRKNKKSRDCDFMCSFDFMDLNSKEQKDKDKLFLLCKEGIKKDAIKKYHDPKKSIEPSMLAAIIHSEPVLSAIRRALHKNTSGAKVSKEDIEKVLMENVLRDDVINGDDAKKSLRHVKKGLKKQAAKK